MPLPKQTPAPLSGYVNVEALHIGRSHVWRCVRLSDQAHVIVKVVDQTGRLSDHYRLRYEYDILQTLAVSPAPQIAKPIELIVRTGYTALVTADIQGRDLHHWFATSPCGLDEAVLIALNVAHALQHVHRARVVHRDVTPGNIIYNRSERTVQLIDFGIASRVQRQWSNAPLRELEGTLAYMAPEQTGRMNRPTDLRSDLYSLGAVLYFLLAGKPPLYADDVLAMVHALVAKQPSNLCDSVPGIPKSLSDVVAKLLRKSGDDRYQSAHGLGLDLQVCQNLLAGSATPKGFVPGGMDHPETLCLPQKLYGREHELNVLHDCFETAALTARTWVVVEGGAGEGKTAVLHELLPQILGRNAVFLQGKYDFLRRNVPLHGICDALAGFVREVILSEPARRDRWAGLVRVALAHGGSSIDHLVPSLAQLVGPLPRGSEVSEASEAVTLAALATLLNAIAAEQTLVLCIDDVQWADAATFKLCSIVLGSTGGGVLLAMSQRNDAPIAAAEAMASLANKYQANILSLQPLRQADVRQWTEDVILQPADDLADVIYAKTGGNAFFVQHYFYHLWEKGDLYYDGAHGRWSWKTQSLKDMALTDRVADLMTEKVQHLPQQTRWLMEIAACLGDTFVLQDLSLIAKMPTAQVAQDLFIALEQLLIVPLDPVHLYGSPSDTPLRYSFCHDRVREATYAGISGADALHGQIGTVLLGTAPHPEGALAARIADHLNHVTGDALPDDLRRRRAQVNHDAGLYARRAAAFALAKSYWLQALQDQPEGPSARFEVGENVADCDFWLGNYALVRERLERLRRAAETPLQRAGVAVRMARTLYALNELPASRREAIAGLRDLGVNIVAQPGPLRLVGPLLRVYRLLNGKTPASIANLPTAHDPKTRLIDELLRLLAQIGYLNQENLFALASLIALRNTLEHGYTLGAAPACGVAAYAMLAVSKNPAKAHLLCEAAELMLTHRDCDSVGMIRQTMDAAFWHLFETPPMLLDRATATIDRAILEGDVLGAGYLSSMAMALFRAVSLGHSWDFYERRMKLGVQSPAVHKALQLGAQMIQCLRGKTQGPTSLSGDGFNEEEVCRDLPPVAQQTYHVAKLQLALFHRDFTTAIDIVRLEIHNPMRRSAGRTLLGAIIAQDCGIALIQHALATGRRRVAYPGLLRWCRDAMAWFAKHGPMYKGMDLWLQAEQAVLDRDLAAALRLYDAALPAVRTAGHVYYEALLLECQGRFMLSVAGLENIGIEALRQASLVYERWGATYKVQAMRLEFFEWRTPKKGAEGATSPPATVRFGDSLDWLGLVRATQALSGEIHLDKLLSQLMSTLLALSGAERAVFLAKPAGAAWTVRAQAPQEPSDIADAAVPQDVLRAVESSREALILEPGGRNSLWSDPYLQQRQPKSVLCLPIVQRNQVSGLIYLENRLTPGVFDGNHIDILRLVAAQAAISLENAELLASLEERVANRTRQLREAQDQLIYLERHSTEIQMAGGFAHEMRNALAGATMLLQDALGMATPGSNPATRIAATLRQESHVPAEVIDTVSREAKILQDALHPVLRALERAMRITTQILDYARLGANQNETQSVLVGPSIDYVLTQLQGRLRAADVDLKLVVDPHVKIIMKQDHLESVLHNLLDNACDALERHSPLRRIEIVVERADARAEIRVRDSGDGVAPQIRERLFKPFVSTKGSRGTGLGLAMSRKLVEASGGSLELENDGEANNTTFVMRMPLS